MAVKEENMSMSITPNDNREGSRHNKSCGRVGLALLGIVFHPAENCRPLHSIPMGHKHLLGNVTTAARYTPSHIGSQQASLSRSVIQIIAFHDALHQH